MIKTKKLAFSAVTVRQLTQNMSDEQLRGVAGGAGNTIGPAMSMDLNMCGNTKTSNTVNQTVSNGCNTSNGNKDTLPQC